MTAQEIKIYDTTLRDGSQGEQINFTAEEKLRIARRLDEMGFPYNSSTAPPLRPGKTPASPPSAAPARSTPPPARIPTSTPCSKRRPLSSPSSANHGTSMSSRDCAPPSRRTSTSSAIPSPFSMTMARRSFTTPNTFSTAISPIPNTPSARSRQRRRRALPASSSVTPTAALSR